jgi:D-tyrosyl-tRNA(Tyr) deacylase
MRAVIQRVLNASVKCESGHTDQIGNELLILLGIEEADNNEDIEWLASKVYRLRIFSDDNGVMNLSVADVKGELMVISQFTLHASTKKGNRPSYIKAAPAGIAIPLYNKFLEELSALSGGYVKRGVFGDHMDISLINSGPVTIIIDTKNRE